MAYIGSVGQRFLQICLRALAAAANRLRLEPHERAGRICVVQHRAVLVVDTRQEQRDTVRPALRRDRKALVSVQARTTPAGKMRAVALTICFFAPSPKPSARSQIDCVVASMVMAESYVKRWFCVSIRARRAAGAPR